MHPDFLIECTCVHRQERFQLTFARRALELLPRTDDTAYEPEGRGLIVLAKTETALDRPIGVLREAYGQEIRIGPPSVRYRETSTALEEPHMCVRVVCALEHVRVVTADLKKRGAEILDAEANQQFGVVHATAPLTALLGFPRKLAELTGAHARHTMWLSHYAPVTDHPPGGDAA